MKEQYWFKRKRYGYGWVPVTWQGWLLTISSMSIVAVAQLLFFPTPSLNFSNLELIVNWSIIAILIIIFLYLVSKKSPPAKWRWGWRKKDNPKLDF